MLFAALGPKMMRCPAIALGLALLLSACGMPVDEEDTAAPEPGQPVVVVRPTPPAPSPTPEPATPSLADLPAGQAGLPTCYQPVVEPIDAGDDPVEPSERIASPGPVPLPPYYRPLPLKEDPVLEERLRDLLGEEVESYGIVVKSLGDGLPGASADGSPELPEVGRGALINPDKVFYAASLFKVTVLFEAFHQRDLGLLDFEEELLVTPYYADFDLGTLAVGVCDSISVEEALQAMTAFSDNTSAVLLQDRVGSVNINRSLAALGLETTRLLPDDLPTTAGEMAVLMEMIARGKAVDEASSQEMVNLLASEDIDNGLRAGVTAAEGGSASGGEGTLVAHKTGLWTNATHDVGIVYLPAGQTGAPTTTYVIAMLSDKGPEDDDAVPLAEISHLVWEYFVEVGVSEAE